jgi:hypothetical protein
VSDKTSITVSIKHSDGPWYLEDFRIGQTPVVHCNDGKMVACIYSDDDIEQQTDFGVASPQQRLANAHLISASPDLLKSAKRALAVLKATNGNTIQPGNVLDALDKAIRKAEGK